MGQVGWEEGQRVLSKQLLTAASEEGPPCPACRPIHCGVLQDPGAVWAFFSGGPTPSPS